MIRNFLKLFAMSTVLMFASCSQEDFMAPIEETMEGTVDFSLAINNLNFNEIPTRSLAPGYRFGDGSSINTIKCYVYNQANGDNAEPVKVIDISVSGLKGNVSIPLPKLQTFDLVILATSIPQTNTFSKLYYSTVERTLKIDYGSIYCNDEELDCFYAVVRNVTTETTISSAILLQRPFAQLNVGAKDYYSYNASHPIGSVAISVDGIYDKINLMNGELIGNPDNVTFKAAVPPTTQSFPSAESSYLAMNYLLVKTRFLSTISVTVNHSDATAAQNMTFKNIALERNYQTNMSIKSLFPSQYN